MSTISTRFDTVTRVAPATSEAPANDLTARLSGLYGLSQKSNYVFGSPLGPFFSDGRHQNLPRFVYFGPHTHDESLRLAFYAGFDAWDQRSAVAVAHFVERLALAPDIGQGLNLSFFPLVDVLGAAGTRAGRGLAQASWRDSKAPEIQLLAKDARSRGYHGFVRIESTSSDVVSVRLRGAPDAEVEASGVELVSSEDFAPWQVRWEADPHVSEVTDGPLTLSDDLPFRAFELTINLPRNWTEELLREAVSSVLRQFIIRHRAHQSYAQHL